MILSSICHVNVDHCQQRCHLQFIMVCADTEIGLGLDSENNNIQICIRPSLKNCQLGVTSMEEKTTGRKGIFIFLRKYYGNAVLTSGTDIKHSCFLETKINHFWAFVERNILFCI